jgi:uncharacterized protein YecA (UPF0149 family)
MDEQTIDPQLKRKLESKMDKIMLKWRGHKIYKRLNPPVGRNDKCPCNSGKKFKHCCIDRIRQDMWRP